MNVQLNPGSPPGPQVALADSGLLKTFFGLISKGDK